MNRRSLLSALPAVLAAGAVPAVAVAAETPIAAMHREITRLQAISSDRNVSPETADEACDRMMELANAIVDLPATTADDLLRKIMGYTVNGNHELDSGSAQIWDEARALIIA